MLCCSQIRVGHCGDFSRRVLDAFMEMFMKFSDFVLNGQNQTLDRL